jgi:hypothetical protein
MRDEHVTRHTSYITRVRVKLYKSHVTQPAGKHVQWSAHEHSILCMDWGVGNLITGMLAYIITNSTVLTITSSHAFHPGGEDCRFSHEISAPNPKPQTPNPKPQTPNPKPEALHPKS